MSAPEHPEVPDSAATVPDKPPRRKRWIPLSLRIFVGVVLALGAAGIVFVGIPAYQQHAAIREIERVGGSVGTVNEDWLRERWDADWMRAFDEVLFVDLS